MVSIAITAGLFLASALGFMNAGGQCAIAGVQERMASNRDDDLDVRLTHLRIRRALIFAIFMGGCAIIKITV